MLGAIRYQSNRAVLHTDTSVLPRHRSAWAALNYESAGAGTDTQLCLHYWLNPLQPLPWFKPVSFWYCHRDDGSLRAIVVEVNKTFGKRHCYLLDRPACGVELRADKVFHVSPFCAIEDGYRFRFMVDPQRAHTVARIDYDDAEGLLLQTTVSAANCSPSRGRQCAAPCGGTRR